MVLEGDPGAPNLEAIAKHLLVGDAQACLHGSGDPIGVWVTWRGNEYFGSVQELEPELFPEVYFLSKMTYILSEELVAELRKLDPDRLELTADNSIELTGNYHILRKEDNTLGLLKPEETEYFLVHPIPITELNPK